MLYFYPNKLNYPIFIPKTQFSDILSTNLLVPKKQNQTVTESDPKFIFHINRFQTLLVNQTKNQNNPTEVNPNFVNT